MTSKHDKYVIGCWLQLYNGLNEATFRVENWPDEDSSRQNIDAICRDDAGRRLAIEHTLIEPFGGEKEDAARFMKTLASLENHPDLLLPGYLCTVNQPVGAVPTGTDWEQIPAELLKQLKSILPTLPEGESLVNTTGAGCPGGLRIWKSLTGQDDPGKFLAGRIWPGDPGPELVIRALERKVPKLSTFTDGKKILLLEQDAIAGTTEGQFEQLPDNPQIRGLLVLIDEVWSAKTSCLESEETIFTNQVWPEMYTNRCSLNVRTGKLWRGPC
jgi:hypothetical protein